MKTPDPRDLISNTLNEEETMTDEPVTFAEAVRMSKTAIDALTAKYRKSRLWRPGQTYAPRALAVINGRLYVCTETHLSTPDNQPSRNPHQWTELNLKAV